MLHNPPYISYRNKGSAEWRLATKQAVDVHIYSAKFNDPQGGFLHITCSKTLLSLSHCKHPLCWSAYFFLTIFFLSNNFFSISGSKEERRDVWFNVLLWVGSVLESFDSVDYLPGQKHTITSAMLVSALSTSPQSRAKESQNVWGWKGPLWVI